MVGKASSRIQKHKDFIKVLLKAKPKLRQALLTHSDTDCIRCLCDIVFNIRTGKISLSSKERKKLKKYKMLMKNVTTKNVPLKRRRSIFIQKGGGLFTILLPAVLSAVTALIAK